MTEPKITDVLWIHSRLWREPWDLAESWVVLHTTRQIAKAVRMRTYPHHLEEARQPYAYGKQYASRAPTIFMQDPRLVRMAAEAAKAHVLHIPPAWDLDPIGDWLAHVEVAEPRVWDAVLRMPFHEIDRRQREWHLSMQDGVASIAPTADIVHRYDDGWSWQHLRTKAQRVDEGRVMQHCVGSPAFDGLEPTSAVFSLRDPEGRSHMTVLMRGTTIEQAYGPRNTRPSDAAILHTVDLRNFVFGGSLPPVPPIDDDDAWRKVDF
ncbi:PcfJ domain-containing protein [Aureimonas sp. SK2]|uniref:PcfJ domain-containing protein n=1 Tax=Aureimonas sp. SK2 TaxID=3015992 RepID=UPI002443B7D9|nr:PcfJ domain-containing protein [Aureimonas sp. SK2]